MTTSMKHVLSGVLSFVAVLVSSLVSVLIRDALQVANPANASIGLSTHSGSATLAGVVTFAIVLFGSLYTLRQTLSRSQRQLPYAVALLTCTCFSPALLIVLFL